MRFFSPPPVPRRQSRDPAVTAQTTSSTTVFSGAPEEWSRYLAVTWKARRSKGLQIEIRLLRNTASVVFLPLNSESRTWAEWLSEAFDTMNDRLPPGHAPGAELRRLVLENESNYATALELLECDSLPSEATREVAFDEAHQPTRTEIVLHSSLLKEVASQMAAAPPRGKPARLGTLWPVVRRVLAQLAYPSYPRDRFKARIDLTTSHSFVSLHLLYEDRHHGELHPNIIGEIYEEFVAAKEGIPRGQLRLRHPYFRMLHELGFLLNERAFKTQRKTAAVIARDFLDTRYMRISLAGVMPGLLESMAPMPYEIRGKKTIRTPRPVLNSFGILHDEDLDAWKKVHPHLRASGFIPLRQLGVGQFGRVYEVLNLANTGAPQRVAVKIDRVRKGRKKQVIQAVETIMEIGRALSPSPHVIRVHDAGRLKKIDCTYHVLQLVDGDTLDNLVGVTGREHASVERPTSPRTSLQELRTEYLKSIESSAGEAWRRERAFLPFRLTPGLSQTLDIVTSTLLWVEEVHNLGFSINDLKNGNLMLTRRGQFKGIDLDTYSRIHSPLDKHPDFFFLAVSLLLFFLHIFGGGDAPENSARHLLSDPDALRKHLSLLWPHQKTLGTVDSHEVIDWICGTIDLSRRAVYAHEPNRFSHDINRLIALKRRLVREEMVLD